MPEEIDEKIEERQEDPQLPTEEAPESQESQDPQEQKSRTQKEFEKLKNSNKELKEERDAYKNVLDSLKPSTPPTPQQQPQYQQPLNQAPSANQFSNLSQNEVNNVFQSMVDADGYLDGNKLMQTLQQLNQRAMNAEQRAARVEEHQQRREAAEQEAQKSQAMKEVHAKYPELDPENENFDEDFYDLVRNELIGQLMQGKEDAMEAADKWASKRNMTREEKQIKEQKEEQKSQINAVRPRSSMMKGYYTKDDNQELINKVRQGKKGALAEALRRQEQRANRA